MIDNPFGGGIKKAPGLLINDWHCKSTKMIGYDIV